MCLVRVFPSEKRNCSCLSALTGWVIVVGRFLRRWEYQTTLLVSWETCMWVRKQQLEPYMEQLTGSKLGKDYNKAVYYHSVYSTYMQSISCKMPGWTRWQAPVDHKLGSGLLGEYQQPQVCRWYHSNGRKQRGNKEPIDESEKGESKSWLKTQHSKN